MAFDFQSGKLGALLVMIAVMVSTAGGFLFNAHDVTSCASNFTYVTDIAGAFDGSKGDMNVDYNPQTNYTGYTVFDPTDENSKNGRSIHGINYEKAGANGYWIQENTGVPSSVTVTLNHNVPYQGWDDGTATIQWGSAASVSKTIDGSYYGKLNADVRSMIVVDGITHYRVVGISLTDLMDSYGQTLDTNNVVLTVGSVQDEYPCFIGGVSHRQYTKNIDTTDFLAIETTYTSSATQIVINPTTLNADFNGNGYGWDDVMFIWGVQTATNSSLNVVIGSPYTTNYIDPNFGVQPTGADVTSEVTILETEYATEVGGHVTTPNAGSLSTPYDHGSKGQVNITLSDGENTHVFESVIKYGTVSATLENSNDDYIYQIFVNNQSVWSTTSSSSNYIYFDWKWNMSNPNEIKVWYNVSNPTDSNVSATISTSVFSDYGDISGFEGVSSVTVTMDDVFSTSGESPYGRAILCQSCENKIINYSENTTNTVQGADNTYNTVTTTSHTETTTEYHNTFWANGYQNVVMDMVISKGSFTNNTDTFYLWFYNGSTYTKLDLAVTYADNQWKLSYGNYIGNYDWIYGDWDAILLTVSVSEGQYTISLTPVSKFDNFTSYVLVGKTYDLVTGGTDIVYLNHIQFPDTTGSYFHHAIVHTTVFLKEGGLYIQDGTFCLHDSFPNDLMVQLKIMAAARSGESMTVTTSEGNTFTLRSNGIDGWVFNDETYRYGDVAIWYIDSEMESVVIESVTYTGAIYYNGQTYDRGHLYIQLGANAPLTDLGESDNTWTVTMNGVWAMSTAYYEGENVADSHIEIDKAGIWNWDKQQFLMVFIGIIALGTIICAWKIGMKPLDWIVVAGTGFVIFMMLG